MSIGIPYAEAVVVDGRLYRICPKCGSYIREDWDPTGEQETNNYGEHWVSEGHEEDRS